MIIEDMGIPTFKQDYFYKINDRVNLTFYNGHNDLIRRTGVVVGIERNSHGSEDYFVLCDQKEHRLKYSEMSLIISIDIDEMVNL